MDPGPIAPREPHHSVWTTVTPLSKFLALAIFVALPFIGGWVGYRYGSEKENTIVPAAPAPVQSNPSDPTPSTRDTADTVGTINAHGTSSTSSTSYVMSSPSIGTSFFEDDKIPVTWSGPYDPEHGVNIYIVPDDCREESCDSYYANMSEKTLLQGVFPRLIKEYLADTGSYTLYLPEKSPHTAYPTGSYRIVLMRGSEAGDTFLAVSGQFQILAPRDSSRIHNVGDKLGVFVISIVKPYVITTIGTTTLRGTLWQDDGMVDGQMCFDVSPQDAWKVPRTAKDNRDGWFCFSNEVPEIVVPAVGTTTVEVANYTVDLRPMGTMDRADFVGVVEDRDN